MAATMEPIPRYRALIVKHELAATDFALGSLDFAAPALAQTHVLATTDFALEPPDFGYDELSQNHQLEPRRQRTGRPRAIPTTAVRNMLIAQMTEWGREEQAKRPCHRLRPGDRSVEDRMMWLARQANVDASYHVLTEQVVRPALKNIRGCGS